MWSTSGQFTCRSATESHGGNRSFLDGLLRGSRRVPGACLMIAFLFAGCHSMRTEGMAKHSSRAEESPAIANAEPIRQASEDDVIVLEPASPAMEKASERLPELPPVEQPSTPGQFPLVKADLPILPDHTPIHAANADVDSASGGEILPVSLTVPDKSVPNGSSERAVYPPPPRILNVDETNVSDTVVDDSSVPPPVISDAELMGHVTITPVDENGKSSTSKKVNADTIAVSDPSVLSAETADPPPPVELVPETEVVEVTSAPPVRIAGVYGVSEDAPGIADNVSVRVGATYFQVEDASAMGGVGILEGSKQIGDHSLFLHSGGAIEYLDGEYPASFMFGGSRLATIQGNRVVKPWIFSAAYDGYYDGSYFGTNDDIYLDQVRVLIGYALKPWIDVGVWGAKGLRSDFGTRVENGVIYRIPGRFGDRVAGYSAFEIPRTACKFILSAGWEDGPGTAFAQADMWVPLCSRVNLFGGVGVSNSSATDAIVGLEFKFSRGQRSWWNGKHWRARTAKAIGLKGYDPCGDLCCDPCAVSCCDVSCYDPCCGPTRYRGGWANDNYRGALRIQNPSLMRRELEDTVAQRIGLVAQGQQVGGNDLDPGGVDVDPVDPLPEDECPPLIPYRPKRESRLSQWLEEHGSYTP
ncbi:MAG: hypothetical protein U1D30_11915 [Planctomycetota bacterium]